jgi:hypothetical protein
MFGARFCVDVPEQGETIHAVNYPLAGPTNAFIAVTGRAACVHSLTAWLLESNFSKAYPGTILRSGLNWVIGFYTLPPITAAADYILFVEAQLGGGRRQRPVVVRFTIAPPRGGYGNIPIQTPTAHSTQSQSFTAWGSTVGGVATTGATMQAPGIPSQPGTPVTGVPPDTWMYQFNNLPESNNYTFSVTDSPGPDTGSNTGITVVNGGLPPPPP